MTEEYENNQAENGFKVYTLLKSSRKSFLISVARLATPMSTCMQSVYCLVLEKIKKSIILSKTSLDTSSTNHHYIHY